MKYKNSYKVSIDFKPWFDSGYVFTKLHMIEELGGSIPSGEIELELIGDSKSLELVTTQNTGTLIIEKEGGNIYNIDVFITGKRFYKNFLTLNFICIKDKSFFTDIISVEWSDIDSALNALYPGNKDIRCKSDISNELKIYQNSESNYSLCTKLAYSYKDKTVFAYGWEGFMLKELIGKDSGGNTEPFWTITGNTQLQQIDSYCISYNKKLYYKPENPWEPGEENERTDYTEVQAKNCKVMQFYNDYFIVGTDYVPLINNYRNNKKYIDSELYQSFRVVCNDIPNYKIGDVVKYYRDEQDNKLPFDTFLVRSNELFIGIEGSGEVDSNGLSFSWTSKFLGVQGLDGSTLPEEDPTVEK